MPEALVLSAHRDGLAVLTLNRPDKLNAINGAKTAIACRSARAGLPAARGE